MEVRGQANNNRVIAVEPSRTSASFWERRMISNYASEQGALHIGLTSLRRKEGVQTFCMIIYHDDDDDNDDDGKSWSEPKLEQNSDLRSLKRTLVRISTSPPLSLS